MRHIDFGVPDRFKRQQALDRTALEPSYRDGRDSEFGKAVGSVQVLPFPL